MYCSLRIYKNFSRYDAYFKSNYKDNHLHIKIFSSMKKIVFINVKKIEISPEMIITFFDSQVKADNTY